MTTLRTNLRNTRESARQIRVEPTVGKTATNVQKAIEAASSSASIGIGTSAITAGTNGRVLYDNSGILGEMTTTGTGTVLALAAGPTFTGTLVGSIGTFSSSLSATGDFAVNTNKFTVVAASGNTSVAGTLLVTGATTHSAAITYGGVALNNAVTGTGNMVLSASPTFSGTIGGAVSFSGALTFGAALTYGGVTLSNAVTGTGNMVLSAGPTLTGTLTASAGTFSSTLAATGDFAVNTNKFTVTASNGNTVAAGTLTAQKAALEAVATLTDGATVALDASLGNLFLLTAAGDRTILAPTNSISGQKIVIVHKASGAARTLTLTTGSSNAFRFGSDITTISQTVSGKTDYIGAIFNSADSRWDVVSFVKGF